MQTGKKAVETVKETASNVAASAKSGMDKTKATMQEKMDKMRAHDDFEKDLATERKDERITEAELRKQEARAHNAAEKEARTVPATTGITGVPKMTGTTHSYSTTGVQGAGTGMHQMSAMPGHGTGQPTGGHVVEGTAVGSHPIGKGTVTGTTRSTTAENRHVGGGTANTGLTGSGYNS